jgi:hypothetical protein
VDKDFCKVSLAYAVDILRIRLGTDISAHLQAGYYILFRKCENR